MPAQFTVTYQIGRQMTQFEFEIANTAGEAVVAAASTTAIISVNMSCFSSYGFKPLVDAFKDL